MVNQHYGVRTADYKLIYYYQLDEWELFDMRRDPSELRSLYSNPLYQDVVTELKAELKKLRTQYQVPEGGLEELKVKLGIN